MFYCKSNIWNRTSNSIDNITYLNTPIQTNDKLSNGNSHNEEGEQVNLPNDINFWTIDNVCQFVEYKLEIDEKYVEIFKNNSIDGKSLVLLTRNDMKEMGIDKMGYLRKIENEIQKFKSWIILCVICVKISFFVNIFVLFLCSGYVLG